MVRGALVEECVKVVCRAAVVLCRLASILLTYLRSYEF